ncbi:MAG TPA: RCC1 domain-containing protein [Polyangiaceae bacterium]
MPSTGGLGGHAGGGEGGEPDGGGEGGEAGQVEQPSAGMGGAGGGSGVAGGGSAGESGGTSGGGLAGAGGSGGGNACTGVPAPTCACIKVAADGNDAEGALSGGVMPFLHVQAAIDFAAEHPEQAQDICIAEGSSCGATTSYPGPSGADLTMRNGVSVYGKYESAGWTRCSGPGRTALLPGTPNGIVFGPSVTLPTVLDGVNVVRYAAATTKGVSITGSQNVTLQGVTILEGVGATELIGVDVSGGARVALAVGIPGWTLDDHIFKSSGTAFGLRSVDSVVTGSATVELFVEGGTAYGVTLANAPGSSVRAFVDVGVNAIVPVDAVVGIQVRDTHGTVSLDDSSVRVGDVSIPRATSVRGVDVSGTSDASLQNLRIGSLFGVSEAVGVRSDGARVSLSGSMNGVVSNGRTYGVWLEDAPQSDIRATIGVQSPIQGAYVDGIHLAGDTTGTEIRGGSVDVRGVDRALAIAVEGCAGAGPLIAENSSIRASLTNSSGTATAIAACGAEIRDNQNIEVAGGATSGSQSLAAITCGSGCTIDDNAAIRVTGAPILPNASVQSIGIGCGTGCSRITGNVVTGLSATGGHSFGTYRGGGVTAGPTPLVSGNLIMAGCSGEGFGLSASGRVENNVIVGPSCGASRADGEYSDGAGLQAGGNADVHSNTIFAGGIHDLPSRPFGYLGCRTTGVTLSASGVSLRNNIIEGGGCALAFAVAETSAGTAALALANNDLLPGGVLYLDEGTTGLTLDAVNALPGAAANFSEDPRFESDEYHLEPSSPCVDRGSTAAAPERDVDGEPRDLAPDVGADELAGCDVNNGGCDPGRECPPVPGHCGPCPARCTGTVETGCVPIPDTGDAFVGVTAARDHACGLRSRGAVECWGYDGFYYGTSKPLCDVFVQVSARHEHSCGLREDGSVECWGSLTAFSPPTKFQSISAGALHDCGLRLDSTAECWGFDIGGSTAPPGGTFLTVSSGGYHTCGLRSDGTITCWGDDTFGQASPPPGVFQAVSSGGQQTCGLRLDGSIECWGRRDLSGWEPPPPGLFIAVAAGDYAACGQNPDRTLTCWSANGNELPPAVPFKSFALGSTMGCGIRDDDTLTCWGDNDYGEGEPPL